MHNKGHKKAIYPFTEQDFRRLSDILYLPLKYKENVVLMCPPLFGRDHRVKQLWERKQDRERVLEGLSSQFSFQYINLVESESNPESIWLNQISGTIGYREEKNVLMGKFEVQIGEALKDQEDLVFFINIPETFSDDYFTRFLSLAQKIYYISPSKIHFILVFDMRWDEDNFMEITAPFRSLFQNTKLLSLYPARETIYFINYYANLWNIKLSPHMREYVVDQSGGILLLAKSALRVMRNEKIKSLPILQSVIHTSSEHKLQIDFFIRRLTNRQRTILSKIVNYERVEDNEVFHMEQMGIVVKATSGWRIKAKFIEEFLTKNTKSFIQKKQSILSCELFTTREKTILTALLQEPGIVVPRSTIAQILWGEQNYEKFSDWAMDKTISRIRSKLKQSDALSSVELYTHKKIGFSLK